MYGTHKVLFFRYTAREARFCMQHAAQPRRCCPDQATVSSGAACPHEKRLFLGHYLDAIRNFAGASTVALAALLPGQRAPCAKSVSATRAFFDRFNPARRASAGRTGLWRTPKSAIMTPHDGGIRPSACSTRRWLAGAFTAWVNADGRSGWARRQSAWRRRNAGMSR